MQFFFCWGGGGVNGGYWGCGANGELQSSNHNSHFPS